jgi:hypothetical protein
LGQTVSGIDAAQQLKPVVLDEGEAPAVGRVFELNQSLHGGPSVPVGGAVRNAKALTPL